MLYFPRFIEKPPPDVAGDPDYVISLLTINVRSYSLAVDFFSKVAFCVSVKFYDEDVLRKQVYIGTIINE